MTFYFGSYGNQPSFAVEKYYGCLTGCALSFNLRDQSKLPISFLSLTSLAIN
nr:MAG TPA: hypothetical protein [Caudoviricetes sp.]